MEYDPAFSQEMKLMKELGLPLSFFNSPFDDRKTVSVHISKPLHDGFPHLSTIIYQSTRLEVT